MQSREHGRSKKRPMSFGGFSIADELSSLNLNSSIRVKRLSAICYSPAITQSLCSLEIVRTSLTFGRKVLILWFRSQSLTQFLNSRFSISILRSGTAITTKILFDHTKSIVQMAYCFTYSFPLKVPGLNTASARVFAKTFSVYQVAFGGREAEGGWKKSGIRAESRCCLLSNTNFLTRPSAMGT